MSNHNLFTQDADGATKPATTDQILAAARQALAHRVRRGVSLSSPQKVREYLTLQLGALEYEVFSVLLVDQRHRLIQYVELFRGTIDGASVYPREVVKLALDKGAAACVLLHNHPSGVAEPSLADERITLRLRDALALVDVRVLDHLLSRGATRSAWQNAGLSNLLLQNRRRPSGRRFFLRAAFMAPDCMYGREGGAPGAGSLAGYLRRSSGAFSSLNPI